MASTGFSKGSWLLVLCIALVLLPGKAHAFGAGNIPSISSVEGHNWRHGDIEDMLSTVSYINGKKWTSILIGRVYFGNWLRDYSQAVDVASLKGVNAATIRILVWILSFMAHGYATDSFEPTEERLGVYRAEEHIDNPKGYAEGEDARKYDPRLRGPVDPKEIEIDGRTGMKNYIANESGGWATSAGYIRFSLARCVHYGRLYTSATGGKSGQESDLHEALRCLGQMLHTLEDFPAHSNYCELVLRELGFNDVFPHVGIDTAIRLRGKTVYPLTTGTFGGVDFLHSVLGEVTDNLTQSEVDEMNQALINAQSLTKDAGVDGGSRSRDFDSGSSDRGLFGPSSGKSNDFISMVKQLPGIGDGLAREAKDLQRASAAQEEENNRDAARSRDNPNAIPGMSPNFDPVKTAARIYPILQLRDKIVLNINRVIQKIPGLEKLLERISETLTAFILGLLAPFIRPIAENVSKVLKQGSSGILGASAKSQYEVWDDSMCSDPTHSMLSKDHFTNILNSCGGRVATTILQYVVPRVIYAWENPGVPVEEVANDILRVLHHPTMRDESCEIQRNMFNTVKDWADKHPHRHELDRLLSSGSVKNGKNHILNQEQEAARSRGGGAPHACGGGFGGAGHSKTKRGLWSQIQTRDLNAMEGADQKPIGSASIPHQGGFGYDQNSDDRHIYKGDSSGAAADYYGGGESSRPPPQPQQQPSYGQHAPMPPGHPGAHPGYGPPPPQPGYGGPPPPGQWGAPMPPPPGHYGGPPPPGPGYGGYPQQPPYPPAPGPYNQPPPGWGGGGGFPGQYRY